MIFNYLRDAEGRFVANLYRRGLEYVLKSNTGLFPF